MVVQLIPSYFLIIVLYNLIIYDFNEWGKLTLALIGAISSGLVVSDAFAAVDMFIKIPGVDGEAQNRGQDEWIELESIQWSVGRSISSGASSSARETSAPSISEVTVTKEMDSTSTVLMNEACCGTSKSVEIEFVSTGGSVEERSYKIILENARISSYSMHSQEEKASESVSLNFEKISWN